MKGKLLTRAGLVSLVLSLSVTAGAAFAEREANPKNLVPLRAYAEQLGGKVKWDHGTRTATIYRLGHSYSVTIGKDKAMVDGAVRSIIAPLTEDGTTYVSLQFLQDALGTTAGWSSQNGVILDKQDVTDKAIVFTQQAFGNPSALPNLALSENLKSALSADVLSKEITALTGQLGAYKGIESAATDSNSVHRNVTLNVAFERTSLPVTIRFKSEGEIDDIFYNTTGAAGPYSKPGYDKPETYTEKEVVIGQGAWALPGTLTLPSDSSKGPFPVLILVQGSGPNDRDESLGALKPFRDLAVGLASKGTAVLRYEKRTREYPHQYAANPSATIKEEALDDALAAVDLMSKTEGIDSKSIYILGHSQGGFMMPRLLQADTSHRIAGSVIMSGPGGNFFDLLIEQFTYLAGLHQLPQATLDLFKTQFALLNSKDFDPAHPPKDFILPKWWVDLKGYEPAEMAKTQSGRMLVLQGERDYQVPAAQLDIWKNALKNRSDVVYKLYPKLNHFYSEGDGGLSTPAEYYKPGNVPDYVIDDITKWIQTR
ncbi:DUF3887 domain-containing protein [Paenibacillus zeisoli]|uniref:DUF3887 domain-containing protein n=1 Tax=Paenibacillus zeisoli TaxID=2496267 RepID=A0A433XNE7_9BACL|nr:stalk domain-containing protein [Paenibacillus zeisoli]RUT35574.1 DUF3887 domain-containing protein [Paenibacillus zeisoli]